MERTPSFFLTLLLLTGFMVVQPIPATGQSFEEQPITSLKINSKVGMTLETISRLTGIHTGVPYSRKAIRHSLDSLYATGLFTDILVQVEPIEGGVAVIYDLTEKAIATDLRIQGNRIFWDRTLAEVIGLQIGEEFTEERWKTSMAHLMNFLQRRGYRRANLTTEISEIPGTNQVRITVKISEGSRSKIRKTQFTGNTVYSNLRLWSLVRSKGGEFYQADLLEEDLRRLGNLYHESGYLKAVVGPPQISDDESTNEVTITIPIEAETQMKISFEGNVLFSENRLTPLLLFREERSYDEAVFRAGADRLTDFYRSQGYPFVKVSYTRKESLESDQILAVFTVQPGEFACLRTIQFVGNTFFPTRRLKKFIRTRPGILSCGIVNPEILDGDVKTIRTRYLEQGFQEVAVESAVKYNEEKTTALLIFTIAEGPRTLIADIQFEGNRALSSNQLQKATRLRAGLPYDAILVRKDQDAVLILYHQHGYVYAAVHPRPDFSEDRTRVLVHYLIEENEQAVIGRVVLGGNTFTKNDVILREVRVKPGDPYDETRILISRGRIQQLGYLGNVRFEPINPISHDSKEVVKDMRLTVQERPTKTLDLGIGYADVEHLRGFIQGTHRNLWGTGRSLSLRAEASEIEQRYSTTYREPWIFGYAMDGRLVAFDESRVRPTYELVTIGGTAGLEKNLTATIKTSLQYQFEHNRFQSEASREVELLPEDERANIASLNPAIFWDTRNDPFNPTSGFLNGLTFRDAALILGSEVQLLKATAQSSWFIPISRWLVLALSARGGIADRFGETELVPLSERFYLGGRSTVRGYEQDTLGVVGETIVPNADGSGVEFIGGNAMLLLNSELRLFLPGGLGLVFFNDRGNVFRNYKDVNIDRLKSTVGAGIWLGTPVGPLRLDYGYKLNREENLCPACPEPIKESKAELHFTLGFAF